MVKNLDKFSTPGSFCFLDNILVVMGVLIVELFSFSFVKYTSKITLVNNQTLTSNTEIGIHFIR